MVLTLRASEVSALRTHSIAPFPAPAALDHIEAAQRAAQERYGRTTLPEPAVPAEAAGPAVGSLQQQAADLLQTGASWEHLPSLRQLEELSHLVYPTLQPQRLLAPPPLPPGPPAALLRVYRTPAISDSSARGVLSSAVLDVPLLVSPLLPEQGPSLHKQLLELEAFAGPQSTRVPPLGPSFKAPDLVPRRLPMPELPEPRAWSFVEHVMGLEPPHRSGPGARPPVLDQPVLWTASAEISNAGLPSVHDELQQELGEQLREGAAGLEAAAQAAVPSLRDARFASCQPPPIVSLAPIPVPLKQEQPKVPAFVLAACTEPLPAAIGQDSSDSIPLLEVPMLLPGLLDGNPAGGATCTWDPEFFAPLPEPPPGAGWLGPSSLKGPSMEQLIAQDMVLEDGSCMLPAVVFDCEEDGSSADSAASACSLLHQLQSECGIRAASTAHTALYLDWSLSSTSTGLRPQALVAAAKELSRRLVPQPLPACMAPAVPTAAAVLPLLLANYSPHQPQEKPPQRVDFVDFGPCTLLQRARGAGVVGQPWQAQGAALSAPGGLGLKAAEPPPSAAAQPPKPKPAAAAELPSVRDDLAYFLQLQQGGARAAPCAIAAAAQQAQQAQSSDSAADNLEEYLQSAARSVTQVALPESHLELLRLLREDEQRLAKATPGVAPAVMASDFLSVEALQGALQEAAGRPGFPKEVLRAYAAMAIIRQTAISLAHHGVRCAHLYFSQSAAELPGLLGGVTASRELRQAYQQVEGGGLEDHPKQAALRRVLGSIETLSPGAKVLVVGDSKSFFTLYPAIMASGFRACQFDRLLQRQQQQGAAAEEAALQQALQSANCVLVSVEQAATGRLPTHHFQHAVLYASEPAAQATLDSFLAACTFPQHVLEVAVGELSALPAAATGAAAAHTMAAPQARQQLLQQQQQGAFGKAGIQQGKPGLAAAAPPKSDWPLVVSSDPGRPIRQQPGLYEAVVQLEKAGAAVVERPLALLDAVLSPSAALIIFDNTVQHLEFAAFLEGLQPVLERVSYAFSKIVLVCQGSAAFQAQVLCSMGQLLAVGQSYGLRLQCLTSTSPAATEAIVKHTATAFLARWAGMDSKLHYSLSDNPTTVEQFLARFHSLNPHSAALLASLGLAAGELLRLDTSAQDRLAPALALVPRHSLELFIKCAASGAPVLGVRQGSGTCGVYKTAQHYPPGMYHHGAATPAGPAAAEGSSEDGYLSPQGSTHLHPAVVYAEPVMQRAAPKRQRLAGAAGEGLGAVVAQQTYPRHQAGAALGRTPLHHMQPQPQQLAHWQQQQQEERWPGQLAGGARAEGYGLDDCQPGAFPEGYHLQQHHLQYHQQLAAQQRYMRQEQQQQQHLAHSELYHGQQALAPMRMEPRSAAAGMAQGGYLTAQLSRRSLAGNQQAAQLDWDPRFEPHCAMNDMVYQRSMRMMQARMGGGGGALLPAPQALPEQEELPDFDFGPQELDAGLQAPFGHAQGSMGLLPMGLQSVRHQPGLATAGPTGGSGMLQGWQMQQAEEQLELGRGHVRHSQWAPLQPPQQQRPMPAFPTHQQLPYAAQQAPALQSGQQQYGRGGLMRQYAGGPMQGQQGTLRGQQAQQQRVDEFGVSLEPSISDEESDHDATMRTRLSPLGLERQGDPIADLMDSRPRAFAVPRLTPPGTQRHGPGGLEGAGAGDQPAAKRRRAAVATITRGAPTQSANKKYGQGYGGGAKRGGGGKNWAYKKIGGGRR